MQLKLIITLSTALFFLNRAVAPVATVNGYALDAREIKLQMNNERTGVYTYFAEKFKLGEEPIIWSKKYKGETPNTVWRQRALTAAVAIKVQQLHIKKYGISDKVNYGQFLAAYAEATKVRSKAIQQGKVVYGLPKYSEASYFNYVLSNQIIALKSLLMEKQIIKANGYDSWLKMRIGEAKIKVDHQLLNRLVI